MVKQWICIVVLLVSATHAAAMTMVVANRAAGTISVIDVATNSVVNTVALPGANAPEPMYVTYNPENDAVLVGDRANNQIAVFNARTFAPLPAIPAGDGVFHMSANRSIGQFWVNNDVDDTVTVIDSQTLAPITTIALPADLVADGGTPHDIHLDPIESAAFITMIGLTGGNSVVLKYSTNTFTELDRETVGGAAHMALSPNHNELFVLNQGADEVEVRSRATLDLLDTIIAPNPHGESQLTDGTYLYSTNISDGGTDGLLTIDTATNTLVDTDDTNFPTPHNIALSPDNMFLYVTHSGATADKVSIFSLADPANPSLLTEVTAGLNPFGIGAVPDLAVPEPITATLSLMGLGVVGLATRRRMH